MTNLMEGLKRQKSVVSGGRKPTPGAAGLHCLRRSRGRAFLPVIQVSLGLWQQHSNLCLPLPMTSFRVWLCIPIASS